MVKEYIHMFINIMILSAYLYKSAFLLTFYRLDVYTIKYIVHVIVAVNSVSSRILGYIYSYCKNTKHVLFY